MKLLRPQVMPERTRKRDTTHDEMEMLFPIPKPPKPRPEPEVGKKPGLHKTCKYCGAQIRILREPDGRFRVLETDKETRHFCPGWAKRRPN